MSSFGDDPIKDLGFVVFPHLRVGSTGLPIFCAFSLHLWKNTKTKSFMLTFVDSEYML